jgi:hypothetical protein
MIDLQPEQKETFQLVIQEAHNQTVKTAVYADTKHEAFWITIRELRGIYDDLGFSEWWLRLRLRIPGGPVGPRAWQWLRQTVWEDIGFDLSTAPPDSSYLTNTNIYFSNAHACDHDRA